MKLSALIADDEPLARERLRLLLADDEDVDIAGECRNGREVVEALKQRHHDVLFLDIEMPGSSGFEVVEQVGAAQMPITVFVTAHNHYALKAFEVHALDYLTKPVEPERLRSALARVKERIAAHAALMTQEQLKSMLAALGTGTAKRKEYPQRLVVPNAAKDSFVNVDEIEWIEAADYYSCIHVGARNLMLRETIKQLAETLDPRKFVRVHRSTIVNIDQVREILREGRSEGWVLLSNGRKLKMSKAGWQALLDATKTPRA
ncbi:MAG: LytTR family DNA-binding domain-containing protein [Terracidiphilus sp.]|jgi:two-component system LytT family response regulator